MLWNIKFLKEIQEQYAIFVHFIDNTPAKVRKKAMFILNKFLIDKKEGKPKI